MLLLLRQPRGSKEVDGAYVLMYVYMLIYMLCGHISVHMHARKRGGGRRFAVAYKLYI
jgi:hypothetical protein